MKLTPLLNQEFACYYQADELVWRDSAFCRIAEKSADRLSREAARQNVPVAAVINELMALERSRDAGAFEDLENDTGVDWLDGRNWPIFVKLVERITGGMKRGGEATHQ